MHAVFNAKEVARFNFAKLSGIFPREIWNGLISSRHMVSTRVGSRLGDGVMNE